MGKGCSLALPTLSGIVNNLFEQAKRKEMQEISPESNANMQITELAWCGTAGGLMNGCQGCSALTGPLTVSVHICSWVCVYTVHVCFENISLSTWSTEWTHRNIDCD